MSTPPELQPPAHPPLVLRVGVTGHRAERLAATDVAQLTGRVRSVLAEIRAIARDAASDPAFGYAPGEPTLRVVSPLAEGADRLVAVEALALGYELQVVLPRMRESYESDFASPASRAEFHRLLGAATAVLELDQAMAEETNEDGYERAGRMVLRQTDVLIALWDGQASAGRGGTAQIVAEAAALELPVVVVPVELHAGASAGVSLRIAGARGQLRHAPLSELRAVLHALLRQPVPDRTARDFRDPPARWPRPFPVYRWFRSAMHKPQRSAGSAAPVEVPSSPEYRWADAKANAYAVLYRNSFVLNYAFSAIAVLFGFLAFFHGWLAIGELLVIVAILWLTTRGTRASWHEQWLHHRLLAEQLRQIEFLWPLGRVTPSFRLPAIAPDDDPRRRWVSWLFRARVRAWGVPAARMDTAYLTRCREIVRAVLESQCDYHTRSASIHRGVDHRLHRVGSFFFVATLIACAIHLIAWIVERVTHAHPHALNVALTLAAVVLPACGAALAGIASQGEFARQARRSDAMRGALRELLLDLDRAPLTAEAIGRIAEHAAELMSAETLDWQVLFRGKPLALPA